MSVSVSASVRVSASASATATASVSVSASGGVMSVWCQCDISVRSVWQWDGSVVLVWC